MRWLRNRSSRSKAVMLCHLKVITNLSSQSESSGLSSRPVLDRLLQLLQVENRPYCNVAGLFGISAARVSSRVRRDARNLGGVLSCAGIVRKILLVLHSVVPLTHETGPISCWWSRWKETAGPCPQETSLREKA